MGTSQRDHEHEDARSRGTAFEEWMADPALYHGRALDRAREKFDDVEAGKNLGGVVGRSWLGFVLFTVFFSPIAALLLYFGSKYAIRAIFGAGNNLVVGLIFIALGAGILALHWPIWRASKPITPKLALLSFYRALGRGQFEQAAKHVIDADLDTFPRYQPRIEKLGRPTGRGFPFRQPEAFKEYWQELVRFLEWPYCLVHVSRVRVTEISDRLCVVDFRLRLTMNTQLYFLLIFVALPLAAIVDFLTHRVVTQDMRKVLVRVGDEWHLFSGDWQGVEEFDTSWLPAMEAIGASPYRGQ
jgi:hypothetical protein